MEWTTNDLLTMYKLQNNNRLEVFKKNLVFSASHLIKMNPSCVHEAIIRLIEMSELLDDCHK